MLTQRKSSARLVILLATLPLLASALPSVVAAPPVVVRGRAGVDIPGARVAWQLDLPLRSIDHIEWCHLVDEYCVVFDSSGRVRLIRADTGELKWIARVVDENEIVLRPVPYHSNEMNAVALPLITKVLFLDLELGHQVHRIPLKGVAAARPLFADGAMLLPEVGARLRCYNVDGARLRWQLQTGGDLPAPPVYFARREWILFADGRNHLAVAEVENKEKVFYKELEWHPMGEFAIRDTTLYVATSEEELLALDVVTGRTAWTFPLPGRPLGGPVLTSENIYQKAHRAGIVRLALKPQSDEPDWITPDVDTFLAEWPAHTVFLTDDGRLALVESGTGRPDGRYDVGRVDHAITNPHNDAVLLCSRDGRLQCLRPEGTPPLKPEDFRPEPEQTEDTARVVDFSTEDDNDQDNAPDETESTQAEPEEDEQQESSATVDQSRIFDPLRSPEETSP